MRLRVFKLSAGLVAVLFGLASVLPAGAQTRYSSQPRGTSVKVDGTSTAHDWEMECDLVGGYIEFGPGVKLDASETTIPGLQSDDVPAKVHALIPILDLHSKAEHAPDIMDHLMQEHLKADQFNRIDYTLTAMTFKGPHVPGTPFAFDTTGNLEIAGVTNKVSFPITIQVLDTGKIEVKAVVPLKMTAFNVDPPAPNIGLGLMRCGDDIKIIIDWTLAERK